jgi:NAD(P)-dependent dehydrogenase (short-subunit alcohol dehydrogenase family)
MTGDLSGKVCVVTGASSGIGRRTALDLAADGAIVCAAARREDRLKALVDDLSGTGHSYYVVDVSRRDEVAGLAGHVDATHGRCDVLVNNAGYSGTGGFSDGWIENAESVMQTNYLGPLYCIDAFMELLERSAPASVVNVASVAGRIAAPGIPAYTASKFALVGWSESAGPDLLLKGIHMSLVEPGFIPTEGFPQKGLVDDPMLRRILGTEGQVSAAIRDAIVNRKYQRVVPRWYYLLQVPRVLTPWVWRNLRDKVMASGPASRARDAHR